MTDTTTLTALGATVREPRNSVECFEAPPGLARVQFESHEVRGNCPVTGQPDLYRVTIDYAPDGGLAVESKSLKLYLWSFAERSLFAEALASEVAHTIAAATGSSDVAVEVEQNVRGGIVTTCVAHVSSSTTASPTPTP